MINEIRLEENGTINIISEKQEAPLVSDHNVVIFEFLPLEIRFSDSAKVLSIFEMIHKYSALKQLNKSISTVSDLYLTRKDRIETSRSPFEYILFQKIVSNTITKLRDGKIETFFLTEPLMFGILKNEKPVRINPTQLLYCLQAPIKIHTHLTNKDCPPYEDGLKFLELIISAFRLNGFINESLTPF